MKKLLLFILFPFILFGQTQIGFDIDGENSHSLSGASVSLSSDGYILAVGSIGADENFLFNGHVKIYRNISGLWTQIGNNINGENNNDNFGSAVCLSSDGSIIAVGALKNDGSGDNSGHVRIYKNESDNWIQIGNDIDGEFEDDESGTAISLSNDGNIIAIGAYRNSENGTFSGHVRIYKNESNNWIQIGNDINGLNGDALGKSVSLSNDGTMVAVGATSSNAGRGYVRIFKNESGIWTQIGNDIIGENDGDFSGASVSLSSNGNIVAIGANGNNIHTGHVRVYRNISETWTQIGNNINGEAENDNSGQSISLSSDGSVIAIGANTNGGNGVNSGHVRIYKNTLDIWTQVGVDIDGEASSDYFGYSVSLSANNNIVAISAIYNENNGYNSGNVRVYDLSVVLSSDSFVLSKFSISPNPAMNLVTIELKDNITIEKISIYNSLGQFIKSSRELTINTSNLLKGIYYLQIETNKGKASKKLIIE